MLAIAVWLRVWSAMIEPALGDDASLVVRVINSAYPPVDIMLVFLLARLAPTHTTHVAAFEHIDNHLQQALVARPVIGR